MSDIGKEELSVLIQESFNSSLEDEAQEVSVIKVPFSKKKELFFSKETPPAEPKRKFFFWNPSGRSSYEKKLVFKMDCVILTYTCLSFFVKYLDVSNVANAYVSGMKEDYGLHGVQYNWLTSGFSLIYAVFGLPGTILITKIPPHILLPSAELLWGFLTLITIATTNYNGLLAVRCIQGAVEGLSYPCINYILGSWYTSEELTKRTAIFCISGELGTMFGGYIQSGVYKDLRGKTGLPAWKWAFIVDFLITLPVAVIGYFFLPDSPNDQQPNYIFSQEELEFARKRVALKQDNIKEGNLFDWAQIKRGLMSWQFYIFPLAYALNQIGEYVAEYWGVALKAEGYSVYQSNNYPTIPQAVGIVIAFLASIWCDYRQNIWELYTVVNLYWIFSFAVIVKYDVGKAFRFFAFCTSKLNSAMAAMICTWANSMLRHDRQLRAFTLGSLNVFYAAIYTPVQNTLWNTDNAPRYQKAHDALLIFQCISTVMVIPLLLFDRYQRRLLQYINNAIGNKGSVEYEESSVEISSKDLEESSREGVATN